MDEAKKRYDGKNLGKGEREDFGGRVRFGVVVVVMVGGRNIDQSKCKTFVPRESSVGLTREKRVDSFFLSRDYRSSINPNPEGGIEHPNQ